MFLPRQYKVPAVVLWLCLCGPKIALYLPLWLLGVFSYNLYAQSRPGTWRISYLLLFALTVPCYFVWRHFLVGHTTSMFLTFGLEQEAINVLYFTGVGLIVCVNILLFDKAVGSAPFWHARLADWIRWAAGASFTLYLVHEPTFALISSLIPSVRTSVSAGLGACAITLIVVFLLAELGERRKKLFVNAFSRLPGLRRTRIA